MSNLSRLFRRGQRVKYRHDNCDGVIKFTSCVVKEIFRDHMIITDIETDSDLWIAEGLNLNLVFSDYSIVNQKLGGHTSPV